MALYGVVKGKAPLDILRVDTTDATEEAKAKLGDVYIVVTEDEMVLVKALTRYEDIEANPYRVLIGKHSYICWEVAIKSNPNLLKYSPLNERSKQFIDLMINLWNAARLSTELMTFAIGALGTSKIENLWHAGKFTMYSRIYETPIPFAMKAKWIKGNNGALDEVILQQYERAIKSANVEDRHDLLMVVLRTVRTANKTKKVYMRNFAMRMAEFCGIALFSEEPDAIDLFFYYFVYKCKNTSANELLSHILCTGITYIGFASKTCSIALFPKILDRLLNEGFIAQDDIPLKYQPKGKTVSELTTAELLTELQKRLNPEN